VQIADELRKAGHQVDVQIGVSGYRIDLAVVDPRDSSKYVLGIVCDGYGYSQAKTARDREILRYRVSEQLGWKLHRVWSLDWWENPERELQKIEQALQMVLQEAKEPIRKATLSVGQVAEVPSSCRFEDNAVQPLTGVTTKKPDHMEEYRPYTVPRTGLPSDEFYSTNHTQTLCKQITDTIEHEGPISKQQLYKRVLQAWGISRAGSRIERRMDEVFAKLQLTKTEHDQTVFFWPKSIDPHTYAKFRVSLQESERRNAEDLPPEEISNAVKHVLIGQISLPREDLLKETVKLLGYQRSGTSLDKVVRSGIEVVIARGFAIADERDRIVLV
jgi:hypothetical protein